MTKEKLNEMLEMILEEYFKDDNQLGLWEIMEYAKIVYKKEIDKLESEKHIHHARADADKVNGLFNQMFKRW